MGLCFSTWLFYGEWRGVFFFPIAIITAFTLTMPFVDLSQPGVGRRIANVLKTIGSVSLVVAAFGILEWAVADTSEYHGEQGAFWGAIPWLVRAALVVVGTLRQKPRKAPARRRWSFSLRTMFIGVTALLALFSACHWSPPLSSRSDRAFRGSHRGNGGADIPACRGTHNRPGARERPLGRFVSPIEPPQSADLATGRRSSINKG